MKPSILAPLALVAVSCLALLAAPVTTHAQLTNQITTTNGPGATNGQAVIKSISVALPKTPEFTTLGGEAQAKRYTLGTWAEIEVEFSSTGRIAEMPMKMAVALGGQLWTGEQTLVDIPAGPSLFTVMYIAPRPLLTALKNAALTPNSIANVQVQFFKPGVSSPMAVKYLHDGGERFFANTQQVPGFVLMKSQTPFANLYWDRYESVRPANVR